MANHLTAIKSMVTTSFAHPSVIMHAFFNEVCLVGHLTFRAIPC